MFCEMLMCPAIYKKAPFYLLIYSFQVYGMLVNFLHNLFWGKYTTKFVFSFQRGPFYHKQFVTFGKDPLNASIHGDPRRSTREWLV